MKTLHVRNVPDDLYRRIHSMAKVNSRSLNAQVIILLSQTVDTEKRALKQVKILNSIQRRRFKAPENAPTSLELLREDRGR
jgi:plasmid stability protein